ncbi:MAG: UDP-3-O-acyl-N-acetylglucosamine deacetylase [Microcoleus sp.]
MTQSTLASEFELSGVGLHSGEQTRVRVLPAAVGEGRYFVRTDLPGAPIIPATVEAVSQTALSTELTGTGDAQIRTVEHLLAALAGMGADNARIEVDGPEVPLLDGSALVWVEAIATAGLVAQELVHPVENTQLSPIENPVWVRHGDAFVAALPAAETRFSYGIDFEESAIGNQWYSWSPETESFASAIAPARTFGLARQVDQLRQAGLIKGGSLENALVCDRSGWLNPPLRFTNEPVRHKILDLVGDLSLLGTWPTAHYLAYKASHNLHVQLGLALRLPA